MDRMPRSRPTSGVPFGHRAGRPAVPSPRRPGAVSTAGNLRVECRAPDGLRGSPLRAAKPGGVRLRRPRHARCLRWETRRPALTGFIGAAIAEAGSTASNSKRRAPRSACWCGGSARAPATAPSTGCASRSRASTSGITSRTCIAGAEPPPGTPPDPEAGRTHDLQGTGRPGHDIASLRATCCEQARPSRNARRAAARTSPPGLVWLSCVGRSRGRHAA